MSAFLRLVGGDHVAGDAGRDRLGRERRRGGDEPVDEDRLSQLSRFEDHAHQAGDLQSADRGQRVEWAFRDQRGVYLKRSIREWSSAAGLESTTRDSSAS